MPDSYAINPQINTDPQSKVVNRIYRVLCVYLPNTPNNAITDLKVHFQRI